MREHFSDRMEDKTLHMQSAEFIEQTDAEAAIACFTRLRAICRNVRPTGEAKRSRSLFDEFASPPKDMKKCRYLDAMPSDESFYDQS